MSESDSDVNGSCQSDGSASRVSFDPTPSDSELNDSGNYITVVADRYLLVTHLCVCSYNRQYKTERSDEA